MPLLLCYTCGRLCVAGSYIDVIIGSPASNILYVGCLGVLCIAEVALEIPGASEETTPKDEVISPDPTCSNGSKIQILICH